jgi:hypothetical protein
MISHSDTDSRLQIPDYCREIESYLCRKNDGHLIRVVGPSFDLVSRWAADGIPLKVAYSGIDRYFERYYRKGPRRRPVRIDYCEADVRDVFDEWRRSVGLVHSSPTAAGAAGEEEVRKHRGPSLPAHLERVMIRLTSARATGVLTSAVDDLFEQLTTELDRSRSSAQGVRGPARRALFERLQEMDGQLMNAVRTALTPEERQAFEKEADEELIGFRESMAPDVYIRARQAAFDRIVRERFRLPTITFE